VIIKAQNVDSVYGGNKLSRVNADAYNNDVLNWDYVVNYLQEYHTSLPKKLHFITAPATQATQATQATAWDDVYNHIFLYTPPTGNSGDHAIHHNELNKQAYEEYDNVKKVFVVYILVHIVCKLFLQSAADKIQIIDDYVDVSNDGIKGAIQMLFTGYDDNPLGDGEGNTTMSRIYLDALVLFIIRELLSPSNSTPTKTAIANWNKIIYRYTNCISLKSALPHDRGDGARGLKNKDVFCYMNSSVQCFNSIPEIVTWAHTFNDPSKELSTLYADTIKQLWQHDHNPIDMNEFVNTVQNIIVMNWKTPNGKEQHQDTSEFMRLIMNRFIEIEKIQEIQNIFSCDISVLDPGAGALVKYDRSVIEFTQIDEADVVLKTLIQIYLVDALRYPKVFVFIVNRNGFDGKSSVYKDFRVTAPETFSHEDFTYELISVSCHSGASVDHGHYISIVKLPLNNQWRLFNDSTVKDLQNSNNPIEQINNEYANRAYVYFYRLQDPCIQSQSS
jgi:hypothetical protein